MYRPTDHGWIEVIAGSMFSGKSEELIRRITRARIAKQKVQVFKHCIDDRYAIDHVVSHNGTKTEAIKITKARDILKYLDEEAFVITIDEVQFFDDEIVDICVMLADQG